MAVEGDFDFVYDFDDGLDDDSFSVVVSELLL